jgi:hypothetical protein
MSHNCAKLSGVVAGAIAVAMLLGLSPVSFAQSGSDDTKMTSWGEPDVSGSFTQSQVVPLERPRELGEQEFYTPEEAAALAARRLAPSDAPAERERGTRADVHYDFSQFGLNQSQGAVAENQRTSIVTIPSNGRIPEIVDAAVERRDARGAVNRGREFDGPENRSLTERCIVWTSTIAPILPGGYNSNMQIAQSPGYVIIQSEMGDPRVIPTDGRENIAGDIRQWNGNSVGHWEGDTLVIETTNFREEVAWRGASENIKVTERLRRLDADTVEYSFLVEDPETWAEPWGGVYPLDPLGGILYEYACHEGNYGIANILAGQRAEEERAAAGQQ